MGIGDFCGNFEYGIRVVSGFLGGHFSYESS